MNGKTVKAGKQNIVIEQSNGYLHDIEEKLKFLENQKLEIEEKYGINEDMIKNTINQYPSNEEIKLKKPSEYKEYLTYMPNIHNLNANEDNIIKKTTYKPSDSYKETLKYEPQINELKEDSEYEYKEPYICLNRPNIPPTSENAVLNNYLDQIDEEYIDSIF